MYSRNSFSCRELSLWYGTGPGFESGDLRPHDNIETSRRRNVFDVSSTHHFPEQENIMAKRANEATQTSTGMTTAIHIPKETWTLLRRVAFKRAESGGGRASVSKVLAELVEQHRHDFEKELLRK
jgi:hypothetical protein